MLRKEDCILGNDCGDAHCSTCTAGMYRDTCICGLGVTRLVLTRDAKSGKFCKCPRCGAVITELD